MDSILQTRVNGSTDTGSIGSGENDVEELSQSTESAASPVRIVQGELGSGEAEGSEETESLTVEELYPEVPEGRLYHALRLLHEAVSVCHEATDALDDADYVAADDAIVHLQALLPNLFSLRQIGDGYGAVINAVLSGLENRDDIPPEQQQIRTIAKVLESLRESPFMPFDQAVDLTMELEEAGLDVNPDGLQFFADWSDSIL